MASGYSHDIEEVREGADQTYHKPTNRKRSARNAKCTKPAADGEGCGCEGGKKGKKTCGCDTCSPKMDSLTAGMFRADLKCGKGAISEGEKCTKGPAQRVNRGKELRAKQGAKINSLYLPGKRNTFSDDRIRRQGTMGRVLGGDAFSSKDQAKRYGVALGAYGGAMGSFLGPAGAAAGAITGAAYGAGYGALAGAVNRATSRGANMRAERKAFTQKLNKKGKAGYNRLKEARASRQELMAFNIKQAKKLSQGYEEIKKRNKGRYGRDSVYAPGFTPDMENLSI